MTLVFRSLTPAMVLCLLPHIIWAHGAVDRASEAYGTAARLFTADASNGELVVVDLPTDRVAARIATPPHIMSLAISTDARHVFVMRGRDTERDMVTVVNTGVRADSGVVEAPFVARTIPAASPGPGDENRVITVAGRDAQLMEGTATLLVFEDDAFSSLGAVGARRYDLAAPDHYFYLEVDDRLYIGFLRGGFVQVLDRETGEELARVEGCRMLHGKAYDENSGHLFYACMEDTMVVGTRDDETNREVARIGYPEKQRVGAFLHGKDSILWGYTEGTLPMLYRLDTGVRPYRFTTLPIGESIRQGTTRDGALLLILDRSGTFEIRDGGSGDVVHSVRVSGPFEGGYHEHVDKAILPDIKTLDGRAYVSLPHEGRIAVVTLDNGVVERFIDIGGEPTRIVLAYVGGQSSFPDNAAPHEHDDGRGQRHGH